MLRNFGFWRIISDQIQSLILIHSAAAELFKENTGRHRFLVCDPTLFSTSGHGLGYKINFPV